MSVGFSKVNGHYHKALFAKTDEESATAVDDLVKGIAKEIEPLLKNNAGPFFGGSSKLTLAEVRISSSPTPAPVHCHKTPGSQSSQVLTGPFVLRLKTFAKHGLLPASLAKSWQETTPEFYKWSEAVIKHPSVNGIFDEEGNVARFKERIAKAKA